MKNKLQIILSGILFAVALSSCGNSATPTQSSNSNSEVSEISSDVVSQEEPENSTEEEPIVEENISTFAINEQSTLGDWSITVTDMKIVDSIKSSEYFGFNPDEGNKYAQVFVTIVNNGKSSDTFLPYYGYGDDIYTKLYYGDGYEFSSSELMGYDNDLHSKYLNPLSSASGEIVFTIPDSVASSTDELIFSLISGNDSVNYKVR